jgi:hypothetical protein
MRRRRRRAIVAILLVASAVAGVVTGLAAAIRQEPDFYAAAGVPAPDDEVVAGAVITRYGDLQNDMLSRAEWGASFSDAEINALLRQHLDDSEGFAGSLPPELAGVRVAIQGDRLKIAARYEDDLDVFGWFSTVGSVELKVWLTEDVNTVAVQVCDVKAGALSVGARRWLDKITEVARDRNIDVTWYRYEGQPVGLFKFYANQARPTTQIRTVQVADGRITVGGRWLAQPTGPAIGKE